MDLRDVAIGHVDRRPGLVPNAFGDDLDALGFDPLTMLWHSLPPALLGNAFSPCAATDVGIDQVAFALQHGRPLRAGHGREFVVGMFVGEFFQSRLVASVFLFAQRHGCGRSSAAPDRASSSAVGSLSS